MSGTGDLPPPIVRMYHDALSDQPRTQVTALEDLALWFEFNDRPDPSRHALYEAWLPDDLRAADADGRVRALAVELVLGIIDSTEYGIVRRRALAVLRQASTERAADAQVGEAADARLGDAVDPIDADPTSGA